MGELEGNGSVVGGLDGNGDEVEEGLETEDPDGEVDGGNGVTVAEVTEGELIGDVVLG